MSTARRPARVPPPRGPAQRPQPCPAGSRRRPRQLAHGRATPPPVSPRSPRSFLPMATRETNPGTSRALRRPRRTVLPALAGGSSPVRTGSPAPGRRAGAFRPAVGNGCRSEPEWLRLLGLRWVDAGCKTQSRQRRPSPALTEMETEEVGPGHGRNSPYGGAGQVTATTPESEMGNRWKVLSRSTSPGQCGGSPCGRATVLTAAFTRPWEEMPPLPREGEQQEPPSASILHIVQRRRDGDLLANF